MSVFALIAMNFAAIVSEVPARTPGTPSICWVSDVVATEKGVRIYFHRKGGPLFVSLSNRIFRPADAPVDPARPDEGAIDVGLGDRLFPTNSPEDGCTLVVVERNGRIGLEAKAYFNPPGLPQHSESDFIPSHE